MLIQEPTPSSFFEAVAASWKKNDAELVQKSSRPARPFETTRRTRAKIVNMGNNMTLQVCDPTGTVCAGDGMLSFTGFGLSVGFDITGCSKSISVGPDATTFTTVCPGVETTAIVSGVNSGDDMFSATDLNSGFEFNQSQISNGSNMGVSTTSPIQGLPSMFMGIPIEEYQRQLGENLKKTFLTNELVSIIIHRTDKPALRINIARKSTVSDIKTKLNIPSSAVFYWKDTKMENHYPIGYFVTEPILHLKLM